MYTIVIHKEGKLVTNAQRRLGALTDQDSERLLNVLAEQMRVPLMQIARRIELGKLTDTAELTLNNIEFTAETALRLLDNYLLSIKLSRNQDRLQLEPVSVSEVLHDTAHQLSKLAKQQNCELELHLGGKYEPIMAHRSGLQAALNCLGYVFIEAQHNQVDKSKKPTVKIAAHRSRGGIVTGMFANFEELNSGVYKRAHNLYGVANQPLSNITASNGAGVFVADSLFTSMAAHLRVARHQKFTGLAATFLPSRQMVLV